MIKALIMRLYLFRMLNTFELVLNNCFFTECDDGCHYESIYELRLQAHLESRTDDSTQFQP